MKCETLLLVGPHSLHFTGLDTYVVCDLRQLKTRHEIFHLRQAECPFFQQKFMRAAIYKVTL